MKGAAEFFQDFLVKDPETGYMVVCPSNSPENHPGIGKFTKSDGNTASIALLVVWQWIMKWCTTS